MTETTAHALKSISDSGTSEQGLDGPISNRRESPRHRTVMRAARLSSGIHKVEGMGLVRNISEGGMLIESRLSFETGEKVVVSLLDGDRIEGEVVWQNGTALGIRFCTWIAVDEVLAKMPANSDGMRPRPPRLDISRPVLLRIDSCIFDARICNISQRGAKIHFSECLAINCRVELSCEALRPVSGNVRWQAGKLVGIEFYRTLDVNELTLWTAP